MMAWGALLFALLVATGAGYRLAYEKHVRSYRRHDPDRLVWLAYSAALFLALFAWPIYEVYDQIYLAGAEINPEQRHPSFWVWVAIPGLVVVTWVVGHLSGRARSRLLTSRTDAQMKAKYESQTGFDFVMYAPLKSQPTTDTMLLVKLKEDIGKEYIVIGHPRYAAASPHTLDVYLKPVFFHGTEEELKARRYSNVPDLIRQDYGVLVRYDDVLFAKVWTLSSEGESNA